MAKIGSTKEQVLMMAKVAEQTERYEDMADFMKRYVVDFEQVRLEDEERNLLSVAFKNIVGAKRSSWKCVDNEERSRLEQKSALEKSGGSADEIEKMTKFATYARTLKQTIKQELVDCCNEVVSVLDNKLLVNNDLEPKVQVFYNKMKGDYFRYQVEVAEENERDEICQKSSNAYKEAKRIANEGLDKTDPILLGLALNYSVFFYEILKNPEEATNLAKQAFDEALPELDILQSNRPDVYKDTTLILQLLRDNLTLWKSDIDDHDQEVEDD